jgi:hypothetical protein
MTARAAGVGSACAASLVLAACSGGGTRDAVAPSRDVVVDGGAGARSPEGYDYVARRPLAVVALAEARGIAAADARGAIDRLANALDTCVTEQARAGGPPRGAARIVAEVGDDGAVGGVSLRVDPGTTQPAVALVCLVAPAKLLSFAMSDGGARGLAVEALWGATSAAPQP